MYAYLSIYLSIYKSDGGRPRGPLQRVGEGHQHPRREGGPGDLREGLHAHEQAREFTVIWFQQKPSAHDGAFSFPFLSFPFLSSPFVICFYDVYIHPPLSTF